MNSKLKLKIERLDEIFNFKENIILNLDNFNIEKYKKDLLNFLEEEKSIFEEINLYIEKLIIKLQNLSNEGKNYKKLLKIVIKINDLFFKKNFFKKNIFEVLDSQSQFLKLNNIENFKISLLKEEKIKLKFENFYLINNKVKKNKKFKELSFLFIFLFILNGIENNISYYNLKTSHEIRKQNISFKDVEGFGYKFKINNIINEDLLLIKNILNKYSKYFTSNLNLKILGIDEDYVFENERENRFKNFNYKNFGDWISLYYPKGYKGNAQFSSKVNIFFPNYVSTNFKIYILYHELSHLVYQYYLIQGINKKNELTRYSQIGNVYVESNFEREGYANKNINENIAVLVAEICINYDNSIKNTISKLNIKNGTKEQVFEKAKILFEINKFYFKNGKKFINAVSFFPENFKLE